MWEIKLENTAFLDLFNFASISSFLNDDFFSLQNDNWKWLEYLDGVDIVFVSSLCLLFDLCLYLWFYRKRKVVPLYV